MVCFVCRDRPHARRSAEVADASLRACRAYAGEYPREWQYPARERMRFVAERDLHEGLLGAYGVPALPPHVRASAHGDDPRLLAPRALACSLLDLETSAAAPIKPTPISQTPPAIRYMLGSARRRTTPLSGDVPNFLPPVLIGVAGLVTRTR